MKKKGLVSVILMRIEEAIVPKKKAWETGAFVKPDESIVIRSSGPWKVVDRWLMLGRHLVEWSAQHHDRLYHGQGRLDEPLRAGGFLIISPVSYKWCPSPGRPAAPKQASTLESRVVSC